MLLPPILTSMYFHWHEFWWLIFQSQIESMLLRLYLLQYSLTWLRISVSLASNMHQFVTWDMVVIKKPYTAYPHYDNHFSIYNHVSYRERTYLAITTTAFTHSFDLATPTLQNTLCTLMRAGLASMHVRL